MKLLKLSFTSGLRFPGSLVVAGLCLILLSRNCFGVDDPGQVATAPGPSYLVLEISWDLGDLGPDWQDEILAEPGDTESQFYLRWREFGHAFASAVFQVRGQNNALLAEIPAEGAVANDGWRYRLMNLGDLPAADFMKVRVQLLNEMGEGTGDASNPVVIGQAVEQDPFLYTPFFVNSIPEIFDVPGIASSVALPGELFGEEWFAGDRRHDVNSPVERGDLWHIGSDTKSMTCTLLALLIQEETSLPGGGAVDWDTPVSAVFPEWSGEMHSRFSETTLRHLACHRSGLRMRPDEDAETRVDTPESANADPRAFRRSMTHRLLTRQHTIWIGVTMGTVPGSDWYYGSGNYLVLGAVIEQLTGQSYEEAMRERLFRPLGMLTAGFGMPVDRGSDQPHGHRREKESPHFAFIDNTRLPPIWNPAGGAFMSLEDWLKFCRLHLTGQQGLLTLEPAILEELHTPHPREFPSQMPSSEDPSYGFGWGIRQQPGNRILSHDGTYGRFYARVTVHLDQNFAVVTAVNIGPAEYEFGVETTAALHNHMIAAARNHLKTLTGVPLGGPDGGGSIGATAEPRRYQPLPGSEGPLPEFGRAPDTAAWELGLPYLPTTLFFGELSNPVLQLTPLERGRLGLRFRTVPRWRYVLERTEDLRGVPMWDEEAEIVGEEAAAEEFISGLKERGFYRVRVVGEN